MCQIETKLEALGLLENTLIVFASDNGAVADGPGSNYPLRGLHTSWSEQSDSGRASCLYGGFAFLLLDE